MNISGIFKRRGSLSVPPPDRQELINKLLKAAEVGTYTEVSTIIQQNGAVLVNCSDENGKTPLHFSANAGHFNIVEFLVKNGADYNFQDKSGWTPLHSAAIGMNLQLFSFLLNQEDIKGTMHQSIIFTCSL